MSESLQVQEKMQLDSRDEKTFPSQFFVPFTDIYETRDALVVVLEMAGVDKDQIDIQIKDDVLQIEGSIDFSSYADLQPVYTEYNVGHYSRRFSLSNKIDQDKISASMADGVLTLALPKAEEVKPRRVPIG